MRAKRPVRPGSSASRLRSALLDGQIPRGDGVPVGIVGGVTELGRDQLLELIGEHVLEHLGLSMDAIPRHPEALDEIELEQPMVAHHLERDARPLSVSVTPR